MRFYIVNYTDYATGGAELLQQYCHALRSNGFEASMLLSGESEVALCEGPYAQYENPYCFECPDEEDSILITYEAYVHILRKYKRARKAIWWLSASNYYGYKFADPDSFISKIRDIRSDPRHYAFHAYNVLSRQWAHAENFVQSEFAREFIRDCLHVPQAQIHDLSDKAGRRAACAVDDRLDVIEDIVFLKDEELYAVGDHQQEQQHRADNAAFSLIEKGKQKREM